MHASCSHALHFILSPLLNGNLLSKFLPVSELRRHSNHFILLSGSWNSDIRNKGIHICQALQISQGLVDLSFNPLLYYRADGVPPDTFVCFPGSLITYSLELQIFLSPTSAGQLKVPLRLTATLSCVPQQIMLSYYFYLFLSSLSSLSSLINEERSL